MRGSGRSYLHQKNKKQIMKNSVHSLKLEFSCEINKLLVIRTFPSFLWRENIKLCRVAREVTKKIALECKLMTFNARVLPPHCNMLAASKQDGNCSCEYGVCKVACSFACLLISLSYFTTQPPVHFRFCIDHWIGKIEEEIIQSRFISVTLYKSAIVPFSHK